jgi:hypothetical protein
MEDIHQPGSTVNGIHGTHPTCSPIPSLNNSPIPHSVCLPASLVDLIEWAKKGIVGRGVLIDYWSWSKLNDPYDPMTTYPIPLDNLKKCIQEQGITFKQGPPSISARLINPLHRD